MENDAHVITATMSLTPKQREIFYGLYRRKVRDYNVALLLAILTGWWVGGHKFYLNKPGQGIIYILLSFPTLAILPVILTIIDITKLCQTVNRLNNEIADELIASVRTLVSE